MSRWQAYSGVDRDDEDHHLAAETNPHSDGHFMASAQSTQDMEPQRRAQQRSSSRAHPSLGFGNTSQTIDALKSKGMGLASFLREKTSAAGESLKQRDWTREQQALSSLKTWGTGAAERVQTVTAQGWKQAAQGIKAFSGGPLSGICKHEAAQRPCPRIALVCCSALVSSGLHEEGLFQKDAPDDLVHFLLGAFEEGCGAVLPPPGTSPHVIAATLKRFLLTLPEPLLTYKLLPHFIQAGAESPPRAAIIVTELPPPNRTTLQILLETLYRVAGNAAENEMDARALALSVAPCLAWHAPPGSDRRRGYGAVGNAGGFLGGSSNGSNNGNGGWQHAADGNEGADSPGSASSHARGELSAEQAGGVVAALEYLIANFQHLEGGECSPLYGTASPTHTLD